MINTAPNPIIIHTEDGTIVKINQAWCDISGYTLEETPTTGIWVDKVYKEQQEKIKSHIRYLFTITQKVDEGEFTFFNKMGAKITWQFSSAPFGYINGKRAVITSAMDVTELKHKDELMLMQSRYAAMGEMIGMIAHQWRQPLALISTIAGTLNLDVMMDEYKKEIFEERLEAICDIAIDLSATITDFRNFFREDKVKEWTTWKELVRESLAIIEPDIKAKNIAIYPIWDEDIPFMTLPRELKQVILNLLKNSEDVLCEKEIPRPQIWIRTSHEDNMICLEIEDNGGGIPEDIIYKVFDPYFSTKMDKDGTGIGLYMSKMIIEQHANGYLKVRNTSLGACFKISLPLIKEVQ
jgi:PAS domain S-box-containing protein